MSNDITTVLRSAQRVLSSDYRLLVEVTSIFIHVSLITPEGARYNMSEGTIEDSIQKAVAHAHKMARTRTRCSDC